MPAFCCSSNTAMQHEGYIFIMPAGSERIYFEKWFIMHSVKKGPISECTLLYSIAIV